MNLHVLSQRVAAGTLTCSEVMEVLMDQPTENALASHAHMHTMEGFRPRPQGFGGDAFSFERKHHHWVNPTHLNPADDPEADFGRHVYNGADAPRAYEYYGGAWQDPARLAADRSYINRTGLPELPAIMDSTYTVYKFPTPMGKPVAEICPNLGAALAKTPVGNAAGHYQPAKDNPARPFINERITTATPKVNASSAHSMFPDSESMVMHLTAALLCDAGKAAVAHLHANVAAGSPASVALFSNTAVTAVQRADTSVASVLIERTLEVDLAAGRNVITGQYPTTRRINQVEVAIDHVEVVMRHRLNGDLTVLTCYPTRKTTMATIGTATTRTEDLYEPVAGGAKTVVAQANPLPVLRW